MTAAHLSRRRYAADFVKYTMNSIELTLVRTRNTSPVNDHIPYWVYRDCVHGLSEVVTMLVNISISLWGVPSAWRTAISKCTPVSGIDDLGSKPTSSTTAAFADFY